MTSSKGSTLSDTLQASAHNNRQQNKQHEQEKKQKKKKQITRPEMGK